MRASIEDNVLYLNPEDVPSYKKRGSMVRNSYFWALRSIAARSPFDRPWEFEAEVWFALNRMLISFFESGYLGTRETQLEFLDGTEVPPELRSAATWVASFEPEDKDVPEPPKIQESLESDAAAPQPSRPSRAWSKPRSRPAPPHQSIEQLVPNLPTEQPAQEPPEEDSGNPESGPSVDDSDSVWPSIDRQTRRSTRLG